MVRGVDIVQLQMTSLTPSRLRRFYNAGKLWELQSTKTREVGRAFLLLFILEIRRTRMLFVEKTQKERG